RLTRHRSDQGRTEVLRANGFRQGQCGRDRGDPDQVARSVRNTFRRLSPVDQNFAVAPASPGRAAPVMYCASSEARKSTALLTARASISGLANRWNCPTI